MVSHSNPLQALAGGKVVDQEDAGVKLDLSTLTRKGPQDETTEQYHKADDLLMLVGLADSRVGFTQLKWISGRWLAKIILEDGTRFRATGTDPWEAVTKVVWELL